MGRHETDPIPFGERVHDSGPMKRIRRETPTETFEAVPDGERKRRAWPVALVLGVALAAAVGVPTALIASSADESTDRTPPAFSGSHSPKPVPTVTVTKNRIEYKTKTPAPVKLPGPTIYRTPVMSPGPTKTVTITKTPAPLPRVTVRITIEPDPLCYRLRDDDRDMMEIPCP